MTSKRFLPLGKITRLHGVKGGLLLKTVDPASRSLEHCESVWLGSTGEDAVEYPIEEAAWMPKGWKLVLSGISSVEEAERHLGKHLFVERSNLPTLAQGEFYVEDLIGADVLTESGTLIGKVASVEVREDPLQNGQDVWWIERPGKNLLGIPAVQRYIKLVEIEQNKVVVSHLEELDP